MVSVDLSEALALVDEVDGPELARLWDLCCPKAKCPGKVWSLVGELYRGRGESLRDAWLMAWTIDSMRLRDQTDACGTMTREVVHVGEDGGRSVSLSRARCGSSRCPHCGVLIVGQRWKQRLVTQAEVDAAAGRPWAFLTLTLDPKEWCGERGLDVDTTAAVQAQRWVGRAFRRLARAVRRRWPDTEMLRAIELHDSQWPHVHVLVRGGLVQAMADEGRGRGLQTWEEVANYAQDQRQRQRAGELRVARCPTPDTRKAVAALATREGFGLRLDLAPVGWADMGKTAEYAAKGPQSYGKAKRIRDVASPDAIAGEMAKGRQRVSRLLARGVRCWAEAGRFLENAPHDEEPEGVHEVRVIATPLDVLVRELREAGQEVRGELVMIDFSGPIPEPGQRRERVLEGVCVDVSVLEMMPRTASDQGHAPREGPAG